MDCIFNFLLLRSMFVRLFIKGENDFESHSRVFLMFEFVFVNNNASKVSMLSLDAVFSVPEVFKKCRSRGALATHIKSILAFIKRAPVKKPAIVAIKEEPAPLQTKISFSKRKTLPSMNANKTNPKGNPKPIPRKAVKDDLPPYVIPTSVIPSDANHKTRSIA